MGNFDDLKSAQQDSFKFRADQVAEDPHFQNTGLADLARGLQYVVNEAAMAAHLHMQKTLDRFFTPTGAPIYREVQLPDGTVVDVPLIALTPPTNLLLEQMEISLAVRIDSMKTTSDLPSLKSLKGDDASSFAESFATEPAPPPQKELKRLSFEISPAPSSVDADARKDNNIMDIKMVFHRDESPEGVARLVALFTDSMMRITHKPAK